MDKIRDFGIFRYELPMVAINVSGSFYIRRDLITNLF